jgi:outer membrane lipoprotein-sorting protein
MQSCKSKFKIAGYSVKVFFILLGTVSSCWAGGCSGASTVTETEKHSLTVDAVLENLRQQTKQLTSYQAKVEYLFSQPLFESQTLRKGVLYYQKSGGKSQLRMNFETLKQDDDPEEKYIEQYIFDGVWLTHIDYQIKQVKRYQQTEPNKPMDAFDLVRENFPIIGFSKTDDLKKEFDISDLSRRPVTAKRSEDGSEAKTEVGETNGLIHLNLKVKPDSQYKDDYKFVGIWIDKKLSLPVKIVAATTEEDIYEIRFIEPKVNEQIDKKVFGFEIPKGFGEEITPLDKS